MKKCHAEPAAAAKHLLVTLRSFAEYTLSQTEGLRVTIRGFTLTGTPE